MGWQSHKKDIQLLQRRQDEDDCEDLEYERALQKWVYFCGQDEDSTLASTLLVCSSHRQRNLVHARQQDSYTRTVPQGRVDCLLEEQQQHL